MSEPMTVDACDNRRRDCPGRKTIPMVLLVPILGVLLSLGIGAYRINADTAGRLAATRAEAAIRAEAQAEMQSDLKRVLTTVTTIATKIERLEQETDPK